MQESVKFPSSGRISRSLLLGDREPVIKLGDLEQKPAPRHASVFVSRPHSALTPTSQSCPGAFHSPVSCEPRTASSLHAFQFLLPGVARVTFSPGYRALRGWCPAHSERGLASTAAAPETHGQ